MTVDDLLYSEITWKVLYGSYVSDDVGIAIMKLGSLGNKLKRELNVLEMFFYKRFVRYDFEKLSELLPKMIFRINMATIFLCSVLYNKDLSKEQKEELISRADELAIKMDFGREWKSMVELTEIQISNREILTKLKSKEPFMTEEEILKRTIIYNKTLESIAKTRGNRF